MADQIINFDIFGSRIEFGWNHVNALGAYAHNFKAKKALIVTDEGLFAAGIPERISSILKNAGIPSVIFKNVSPNPTDKNVLEGTEIFSGESCDLLIGVGGGSTMDAAKGIRVLSSHKGPLNQYLGIENAGKIIGPMPVFILIPTTSGTGSEVSRGAVITDTRRNVKCVLRAGMPTLSLLDPELTVGMPPFLTAATGMDALSHNIEAFLSPKFHPVAEAIAYEGIRLVAENLPAAVEDGKNVRARTNMAMASAMGALAFQKGLGATHSLAHQLSTEFDVHHGAANGILLPHTMRFNKEAAAEKLTRVAAAMGVKTPSPDAAIKAVAKLNKKLGLPMTLSEVNVTEKGIPVMARNAMEDWCHPTNPRPCTEADMVKIFKEAL